MLIDFAPMEGVTGAAFRKLHHKYFAGADRYYAPFLSPTQDHRFTPRELRELLPEHNEGICLIPQILTRQAEDFLWAAKELHAMGYAEVNLNLGCPSGTVTAKGKGSGMLSDLSALDRFLDTIYSHAPCKISVKTRLGMHDPEEFDAILEIYNRYPISELIIHPRIRQDLYRHPVRPAYFAMAYGNSANPVSYNGSIITPQDYNNCVSTYPHLMAVMIGQGLISDPFLIGKIRSGVSPDKAVLKAFHDELLASYAEQFGSLNNAVKRMKELWFYLIRSFGESTKHGKQIMKARSADEYLLTVGAVFRDLTLLENSAGGW